MTPVTLICVLRSGGDYAPGHVEALRDRLAVHAAGHPFLCLTDAPARVPGGIPLRHGWPGWWAKIEAFRFRGPCLLFDLDTVVRADLSPLLDEVRRRPLIALADFDPRSGRGLATGLVGWSGDRREIYDAFARDPSGHMAANASPRWWGDGGFVERMTAGDPPALWQQVVPGAVASWKLSGEAERRAARVVCFHGRPRPWEVAHGL